jgi:hypothetical protein
MAGLLGATKKHLDLKEEVKLSVLVDGKIIHTENHQELTKNY